jgi:hypothetical protein
MFTFAMKERERKKKRVFIAQFTSEIIIVSINLMSESEKYNVVVD